MKKIALFLTFFIIAGGVYFLNNTKPEFQIVATSYESDTTTISSYKKNDSYERLEFEIGGVENYDEKNSIMFDKYGDKLITISPVNESKEYIIEENPMQISEYNGFSYILHNEGINSFSIKIYDKDYTPVKTSEIIDGFARNFLVIDDILYILANNYDEENNRSVLIYQVSMNDLTIKSFIEIPTLTYGFYIRENKNKKIEIYGHENEETKYLTISLVDIKTSALENTYKTDIPSMWVSKVIDLDDEKIIFNSFSIIKWDANNQFKEVFSSSTASLIDLEYNQTSEIYYLLLGDHEKNDFKINKLNSTFEVTEEIELKENFIPTDLLLQTN